MLFRSFHIIKSTLLLLIFLFLNSIAIGQYTKVRGRIIDSNTKEAIPFVNVAFQNTSTGTISDFEGNYFLESRNATDSLVVSYIGYKSQTHFIQKHQLNSINIELKSDNIEINEVVVLAGENPAFKIIRNIVKNKKRNSAESIESYNCEIYNKIEIDVNNIDDEFKQRKALKHFQFIFDYIDTSVITGKSYLPIFISESLSDFYYRKSPKNTRENIIASKISGVENESVSQFTGQMYQNIDIYENNIDIFDQPFVSPISGSWKLYYKYYLIDSSYIDNLWCYHISFKPRRKQEFTFTGDFWVHDTTFAIVKSKLRIAGDANINFINDFVAEHEYRPISDSIWFLSSTKFFIDFNITDQTTGFFGRKFTSYKNVKLDGYEDDKIFDKLSNVIVEENAFDYSDDFWHDNRHEKLSAKEEGVYDMVDSIKNVPAFNTIIDIITTFITGYYVHGLWEWGPYYTFMSFNEIEGARFKLGGRTSNEFSTKIMFDGHIAASTKDQTGRGKFKYGLGAIYILSKNPRQAVRVHYKDDVEQLGKSQNAFLEDNILSSILQRNPNYKLTNSRTFYSYYEHEWFQGFSNTISFTYKQLFPSDSIPLSYETAEYEHKLDYLISSEIKLNTRFAYKERFIYGEFERESLGSSYPILNMNLTYGPKNLFNSNYEYFKLDLNIYHWFNIGPYGWFKYTFDAGKIFGKLPYPLLRLHEGNETYALDTYAFNMMNYYEFVSDEYMSIHAEHHFMGLFLNRFPLLRKLKWREVAHANVLVGNLNEKNLNILDFPGTLSGLEKPYIEAGIGIENIFKFIRIDAVWRLSYLNKPDVYPFGIRGKLQIAF